MVLSRYHLHSRHLASNCRWGSSFRALSLLPPPLHAEGAVGKLAASLLASPAAVEALLALVAVATWTQCRRAHQQAVGRLHPRPWQCPQLLPHLQARALLLQVEAEAGSVLSGTMTSC